MDIFISRNGQNQGPYTLDEFRDRLEDERIDPKEHAWHEGLEDWIPAEELLKKESGPEPVPLKKQKPKDAEKEGESEKASDPEPKLPEPKAVSPQPASSITDTPARRSTKLRPPGSVPPPTVAPEPKKKPAKEAKVETTSESTPDGTVVSKVKLSEHASLPTPEPVAREGGGVKTQTNISSAPPKVHVRKKAPKEYPLSRYRLLGVPAVILMLLVYFMPWVRVQDSEGFVAAKVHLGELMLTEDGSTLPLGFVQPKGVPEFGRLFIVCALAGALFITVFCFRLALQPPDVISFGGLSICAVTIVLVAGIGYIYGTFLENKIGEEMLQGAKITMDMGFWFALAIGVFGFAMILIPNQATSAKMVPLLAPVFVVIAGSGYLFLKGMQFHKEGGPGIQEVIDSIKGFAEELTS